MIRIWDNSGTEIDITEYGLRGLRLIIPSPSYEVTREVIPGRSGAIKLGKDLSPRELVAEFMITAADYEDSLILRDELYQMFRNPFYIGESKQPDKRWSVECVEPWIPDRINHINSTFSLDLFAEKGVAETVLTTKEPSMFAAQFTGTGSRIIKYEHFETNFEIFNGGNVEIDPRELPLIIDYRGASTNLQIENLTTSETWSHTGTSNAGDLIQLDGIRSTKNGLSIFRNTNKKLITLAPGWNEFSLNGTSGSFEIAFDFRFYYL